MVLLLDNYDSFVYNLARYVRELGEPAVVRRSDRITLADIEALKPSHIIISPGPGSPAEAGCSVAAIRAFGPAIPILGVCLGHQCIGAAFGGRIVRSGRPVHGRTSPIQHGGSGIFEHVPTPFRAARYHSLVIEPATVPDDLRITAHSLDDGEIMGVEHRRHPIVGVQFHPESVATEYGHLIIGQFLHGSASRGDWVAAASLVSS